MRCLCLFYYNGLQMTLRLNSVLKGVLVKVPFSFYI
nr:MAG TPA: hypothetical protein [Herelleviridae sp.]